MNNKIIIRMIGLSLIVLLIVLAFFYQDQMGREEVVQKEPESVGLLYDQMMLGGRFIVDTLYETSKESFDRELLCTVSEYEKYAPYLIKRLETDNQGLAEHHYNSFMSWLYQFAAESINAVEYPNMYVLYLIKAAWLGMKTFPEINDCGAYINEVGGWEFVEKYFETDDQNEKDRALLNLKDLFIG